MIEKLALNIVSQMEKQRIIGESNSEYYGYALITMIENTLTVGSVLFLGFLLGEFLHTVCFWIFFLSLRKRTGGFHANKFWQCYFVTVITYCLVITAVPVFCRNLTVMYGMLFAAVIIIWVIGTVNHPNMDMSEEELQESRKAARLLVLMELMIIAALSCLKADIFYIVYMSIAVILCAFLMCLAKFIKQEVRKNEKK